MQYLNAIYRHIVGGNVLRAFGHPVGTCCVLKIELMRMPKRNIVVRTFPNDYNIMQHPQILHEKFDHFKFEPTKPNMSQHVVTRWSNAQHAAPNNVAICCVDWCCYRGLIRATSGDPKSRNDGSAEKRNPNPIRWIGELWKGGKILKERIVERRNDGKSPQILK